MEFRDLKRQYQNLKKEIDSEIENVIKNTTFISGSQVKDLERQLSEYVGRKYCVSCGNGTDALTMSLMALGIGEGDAVFVPDFTFFATAEVVAFEGAVPIFVDVDENTFNMDPESLEAAVAAVTKEGKLKPKAIITVDLFGLPADYPQILKIADKYEMKVIEDSAQGFGGSIKGKMDCSFGDISTTSFFPAKPLGCYGDGGAIFTDDEETAAYLQSIRVHGKGSYKYENIRIGWNSRLDTLQAAIMLPKFKAFKEFELDKVNEAAVKYTKLLSGVVKTPTIPEGYCSSWAQYTIQLRNEEERDGLQAYLKEVGIPTMVYYPIPLHKQEAFAGQKIYLDCPTAEKLCKTVLSLPMHPYFEEGEIEKIVEVIKEYKKIVISFNNSNSNFPHEK